MLKCCRKLSSKNAKKCNRQKINKHCKVAFGLEPKPKTKKTPDHTGEKIR